jgi:hypothetical protein
MADFTPNTQVRNHPSASNFIDDVHKYIREEIEHGVILGPYDLNDFDRVHVSLLMSRPKDTNKRRIIVDLSYPYVYGSSVNSVTSAEAYLGVNYCLKLPTVDTICAEISNRYNDVKLYKIDLARAFRKIKIDPADIFNLGLNVDGSLYLDPAAPFGWRSGTLSCQHIMDCIRYILKARGVTVINYIDDLIGVSPRELVDQHFNITKDLLEELNFQISTEKTVPPSVCVICLGIVINCDEGILKIPEKKMADIIDICKLYLNKKHISRTQLQSLIGSIIFMHKAVKPAHIFINRILALLKK